MNGEELPGRKPLRATLTPSNRQAGVWRLLWQQVAVVIGMQHLKAATRMPAVWSCVRSRVTAGDRLHLEFRYPFIFAVQPVKGLDP